jgi:hypothetical protein
VPSARDETLGLDRYKIHAQLEGGGDQVFIPKGERGSWTVRRIDWNGSEPS